MMKPSCISCSIPSSATRSYARRRRDEGGAAIRLIAPHPGLAEPHRVLHRDDDHALVVADHDVPRHDRHPAAGDRSLDLPGPRSDRGPPCDAPLERTLWLAAIP
jgi:hypothetical protein